MLAGRSSHEDAWPIGRHVFAVGGKEEAARRSGAVLLLAVTIDSLSRRARTSSGRELNLPILWA